MTIRAAVREDLPALVSIYNHYVVETHVTFDTAPFTAEARRPWLDQFDGERYQCLVLESDGAIAGYATSVPFKSKAAYETSVEVSVYLKPEAAGRGYGSALYGRLLPSLSHADLHRAYAGIALPNPASVALHARFGFQQVATFTEVGRKFGRYWDVVWMECPLDGAPEASPARGARRAPPRG